MGGIDPHNGGAKALLAIGQDSKGIDARCRGFDAGNAFRLQGEPSRIKDCLAQVGIVGVARCLKLRIAVEQLENILLHLVVDAELKGQHEDE